MGAKDTESPLAILERWEDGGAMWRALHVSEHKAIVDLCTCTGEPVEQLESDDPELIRLLERRPTSEVDPE
jgi:hypothetical protein